MYDYKVVVEPDFLTPPHEDAVWHIHWDKHGQTRYRDENWNRTYDKKNGIEFETALENGGLDILSSNSSGKPIYVLNRRGHAIYSPHKVSNLNNNIQIKGSPFFRFFSFSW